MIRSLGNTKDETNFSMMQPCKPYVFIQSRRFMRSRVGCYYGTGWTYGLTYFSFWEVLLWPASALNCALFPESKGRPRMEKINWDIAEKEGKKRQSKQTKWSIKAVQEAKDVKLDPMKSFKQLIYICENERNLWKKLQHTLYCSFVATEHVVKMNKNLK